MEDFKSISNKKKAVSILYFSVYVLACFVYWQFSTNKHQTNISWADIYKMPVKNQAAYADTKNLLDLAIDHNPYNEQLQSDLNALEKLENATKTLEHYLDVSSKLQPNNPQNLSNHAKLLLVQGKYSAAEEHLVKAIAISPSFGASESLLMEAYHKSQNWTQLQKLAEEIIQNKTDIANAKNYLEIAQRKKTILMTLEELTRRNPSAINHLELSRELYIQKRFAQSFHHASIALQKQQDLSEARLHLGLVYVKLGEPQKAIKSIKAGLHLDSNFQSIIKSLALLEDFQLESEIAYQLL